MRVCALKEILQELPAASGLALDRLGKELNRVRLNEISGDVQWLEPDVKYRERLEKAATSILTLKAGTEREDVPVAPPRDRVYALTSVIADLSEKLCSIRQYDHDVGDPVTPEAVVHKGVGVVQVFSGALDSKGARVLAARLLRAAEQLEEKETL